MVFILTWLLTIPATIATVFGVLSMVDFSGGGDNRAVAMLFAFFVGGFSVAALPTHYLRNYVPMESENKSHAGPMVIGTCGGVLLAALVLSTFRTLNGPLLYVGLSLFGTIAGSFVAIPVTPPIAGSIIGLGGVGLVLVYYMSR